MKKALLITIGIVIILIVVGVWAYLFTFGTPQSSDEVFAKFGFGGEEIVPTVTTDTTIVDVAPETTTGAPQKLRQLTTRPVAGAIITGEVLRYIEQGTGHLYAIDLTTGSETLVRGTTIPQTIEASFSKDGSNVALTTYTDNKTRVMIDSVTGESGSSTGALLPEGASQITFTGSTTLNYVITSPTDTSGFSYDVKKKVATKLFTIPLRDVRILWGKSLYAYTTPSGAQMGYIYSITGGTLSYLYSGKIGLTATPYASGVIITNTEFAQEQRTVSSIALSTKGVEQYIPVPLIPEKCTQIPGDTISLYCASPSNINTGMYPDDWYKGKIAYSDILWKVNTTDGESVVLSNFKKESGREIDAHTIGTDTTGSRVFIISKNDNTLWLFDTAL